jgi:sialidase-1
LAREIAGQMRTLLGRERQNPYPSYLSMVPTIHSHRILYHDPAHYSAWPALVRATNGDLVLTFCRTPQHMAPDGTIVMMRSTDQGASWTEPVVVVNTPIDDRENGLTVGPDGELLLHVWSNQWQRDNYAALDETAYPRAWLERWMKQVDQPAYRAATAHHGSHVLISRDHGVSWTPAGRGPDTIHGGVALRDGSLLVAAYRPEGHSIHLHRAPSSAGPWTRTHTLGSPAPAHLRFGEPHVAQLPSGRIVVMIRATAIPYDDHRPDLFMWASHSDDNGATWAEPYPTPLPGYPPHLLTLSDGRLLVSYGRRRPPYGQRAAVSADGITWTPAAEFVLREDAPNHDLGYPASVELAPGRILTVYYQKPAWDPADKHRHTVAIMATEWSLPA